MNIRVARRIAASTLMLRRVERIEYLYVDTNPDLLGKAPVRFQHDDYHAANLIVHRGRFPGVVDFNRCDWGDPVEDFYKLPWFSRPVSTPFARGQVRGTSPEALQRSSGGDTICTWR